MMKRARILLIALVLIALSSQFIFAGSINSNEQRIIGEASGRFTYNGVNYVASTSSMNQLKDYLLQDDIDLTAEQADKAISLMYQNVKRGVLEGYIIPTSGQKGTENQDGNDDQEGTPIMAFTPASPIKNTGFSLNIVGIALAVIAAIAVIAGFVKKNSRLYRYIMPVAFTLILCASLVLIAKPIDKIFTLQVKSIIDAGNPDLTFASAEGEALVPQGGSQYSTITCEDIKLDAPVYYGDTEDIFQQGVGQYMGSGLPGEGKTIILGGHDMTYFAPLEKIEKGMVVTIKTPSGDFDYKVDQTRVADDQNYLPQKYKQGETLILYTCYPFGDIFGERTQRFYVYCVFEEVRNGN